MLSRKHSEVRGTAATAASPPSTYLPVVESDSDEDEPLASPSSSSHHSQSSKSRSSRKKAEKRSGKSHTKRKSEKPPESIDPYARPVDSDSEEDEEVVKEEAEEEKSKKSKKEQKKTPKKSPAKNEESPKEPDLSSETSTAKKVSFPISRPTVDDSDRLPSIPMPSSPLPEDQDFDWNGSFQQILKLPDSFDKYQRLSALYRDFCYAAKTYGRIIISEKYLPTEKQTVKPFDAGGRAGGVKYRAQGIYFKFAVDTYDAEHDYWMYGIKARDDGCAGIQIAFCIFLSVDM